MDNKYIELFINTPIIKGLSQEAQERAKNAFSIIHISKDQILFHQDDNIKNLYILLRGKVSIFHEDKLQNHEYEFATLGEGEIVGEQTLFHDTDRSAAVAATTDCTLAMISQEDFQKLTHDTIESPFWPMMLTIKKMRDVRLRNANDSHIKHLQKETQMLAKNIGVISFLSSRMLNILSVRKNIIQFFISIVFGICVFSFLLQILTQLQASKGSSAVTIPLTLTLVFWAVYKAIKFNLKPKDLGFRLDNWKRAIFEAIIFTLPVIVSLTLIKFIVVTYITDFQNTPVIEFGHVDVLFTAIYVLISIPMQEFIARSVLQGSLQTFFETTPLSLWTTIIISNVIFGVFHVQFGEGIAIATVIAGMFFGWLYSRQQNFFGVWLSHAIVGVWCLDELNAGSLFT